MHIISCCTILFILTCRVQTNENDTHNDWKITFNPPEVTAVSGLCALISCTFIHPDKDQAQIDQENVCNNPTECKNETEIQIEGKQLFETEQIKLLEPDLTKYNCSRIIKEIKEDEREIVFKIVQNKKTLSKASVKIIIQDEPIMKIPPLREGEKADLTCSAPFPCPETSPNITWWIRKRGGNITDLKDNITLSTSESLYLSTLTLTPTSDDHNATVGCNMSYGSKIISTNRTLNFTCVTTDSKVNESSSPKGKNNTQNDITSTTGIIDFLKNWDIPKIVTFVAGMVCSALIFSVVLCCCVSCHRGKKHKVPITNPDTEVNLEMVQTDTAQTGTNEETPLQGQLNGGNPNTTGVTDGAEEDEAVRMEGKEVDYASIDYSLLKDRPPEEEEKEPTDTDYAEIKKDKIGDGKQKEVLQDGDDQIETQDQMEGEETRYSNSEELKI
ncbi:myeloid cell surface antigen CD33 isoform X8 [Carassius gibelio]|uniref:myeloid cell surface antigen CD33 isoform X6 n=1 Tax=Carassius gibelio TaxID=101364 RepID=UPI0022779935|nr:myeloid cell surface antigen CD33 isoform X6 [Carassius gibelio]XP_052432718.1 myeloid cell surface antigen CD33 isoform X7 [Carassius gibelio]XP_052432719.1 myeloid cell surface antigen CD33 isoform X8 [Carassius gibelio]